ncbi:MAG TPA: DEAD/DEAH box helicase [Fimbriimonadaceae bacterium]|nr:DEAD/DEAH box helicase [Fimbriimonadaceae bacterium]
MGRFTLADIESSFDHSTLNRAAEYVRSGRVMDVGKAADGVIMGTVQGSDPFPYFVRLIMRPAGRPHIEGHCTCPVGMQCKHCAAVALAWRTQVEEDVRKEPETARLPADVTDWLARVSSPEPQPDDQVAGAKQRAFYILDAGDTRYSGTRTKILVVNRSILKDGRFGAATEAKASAIDNRQFAKHFNAFDRTLLTDLAHNAAREDWSRAEFKLDELHGVRLLRRVLQSGRCMWAEPDGTRLHEGPPRSGRIVWQTDRKGEQRPTLEIEGGGQVLPLAPPWYADERSGECGPIDCGLAPSLSFALLTAPPIAPEYAESVRTMLRDIGVDEDALPSQPLTIVRLSPEPVVHLAVEVVFCDVHRYDYWRKGSVEKIPIPFAKLSFRYGDLIAVPGDKTEIRKAFKDRILIVSRDPSVEADAQELLEELGWDPSKYAYTLQVPQGRGTSLCMKPEESGDTSYLNEYRSFLTNEVPNLRKRGWIVEAEGDFHLATDDSIEWDVGIEEGEGLDWFEFKLKVRIEGKEVPLRPILLQLLKSDSPSYDRFGRKLAKPKEAQAKYVTLDGGTIVMLTPERVQALIKPLLDLFGPLVEWPEELRLPKSRLIESEAVAASMAEAGLEWKSPPELQALTERLKTFSHLDPLGEPEGFTATLRDYQREGLAWLQFLREYGFGGILADDMGLGKTVQVLAHIQLEKLAGRLDWPCLVVAPTSTLPNWRREAERFTPDLSVAVYHGPKRGEKNGSLAGSDLVVTNYALLARDRAALASQSFHLVVLDEAQNVKNAATAAAKAARDLKARHRLCLSGTPIENHLDELWSLFHFLMPGFLDSAAQFRQKFRAPIEQRGDEVARARLARMVRPFMLRRTKQQVVTELPPKTEILETIDFGDQQRELYETLRLAMDERVRGLLEEQGLAKSRIQVLDALLKLRQVCCDPRLVKLPAAKSVSETAKLDRLVEMLTVLLEDGRRILLFSQFTSMLDLIEARVREIGVDWVRITGDTQDRETPVRRFEQGEAPLFLISLKAGGTGLNLVAADTVIHYDPWWNPAVENQATDRAYRIGQDKPVMVYKLVVAGTVEEKILELQRRKGDLAASILSESERAETILDAADLQWLLSK